MGAVPLRQPVGAECTAEGDDDLRLGLGKVNGIDRRQGARAAGGEFSGVGDLLARAALENPARCGGLDSLPDVVGRRADLWRIGAGYQSGIGRGQLALLGGAVGVPAGVEACSRLEEMLAERAWPVDRVRLSGDLGRRDWK